MSMQTRVFRAHHSETSVQQQQQREKGEIQQMEYAEKERERERWNAPIQWEFAIFVIAFFSRKIFLSSRKKTPAHFQ